MRNLYLVRHGKPEFSDGVKRCIGLTDVPLGETGISQAKKLQEYMDGFPITRIYSSPLKRCVKTASIISGGKIPVTIRDDLKELNMGEWENVPLREIKKGLESEPARGEKRVDGLRRFRSTIDAILAESDGDLICVAHAGINCCYLSDLLGTDLNVSRGLPQPYGGFSRIEIDNAGKKTVAELGCMSETAPDEKTCLEILAHYHTPGAVIRHGKTVAHLAAAMAASLKENACPVNTKLLYAGALLHDVAKGNAHHAETGAQWLEREGYPFVAALIRTHHDMPCAVSRSCALTMCGTSLQEVSLEAALVYLADKYVLGETVVSLEERFAASRERILASQKQDREAALSAHTRRYREAKEIEAQIKRMAEKTSVRRSDKKIITYL